jgi:hypothetical protein
MNRPGGGGAYGGTWPGPLAGEVCTCSPTVCVTDRSS